MGGIPTCSDGGRSELVCISNLTKVCTPRVGAHTLAQITTNTPERISETDPNSPPKTPNILRRGVLKSQQPCSPSVELCRREVCEQISASRPVSRQNQMLPCRPAGQLCNLRRDRHGDCLPDNVFLGIYELCGMQASKTTPP